MKNYRGYYIDGVIFHSKSEIDAFIKEQAINKYKMYCRMFHEDSSMELIAIMSAHEIYMHDVCGMEYGEIEDIQIATFAEAA